ncbi:MAG: TfoX/Sxy family protein [Treponemataceae bacterium]|nr:TfoX/Sxy family protein [Treponemataceae bacterium]
MATTKEYKDFILEQLNLLDNINCRAMMGEYLLYYNDILFGGIYDNNLLVKIVNGNEKYNMQNQIPYEGAKPMYLVDDIDNKEILREIVIETCKDLLIKKR